MLCLVRNLALCVMLLVGCAPVIQSAARGGIDYPYGPASMHLHSLSRLTTSSDGRVTGAVVFVEYHDRDKQSTRATGVLEVTLRLPDKRIVEKSINLTSLDVNDELWSRTVRMYRLDFQFNQVIESVPSSGIPVTVSWTPVDGNAVTARGDLFGPSRP